MLLVRLLILAVGLGALGLLMVGLVAVIAPFLPGFGESFRQVSGVPMESFGHDPSTYAIVAFAIAVLPWLALSLGAGWGWRAAGRKENRQREGLLKAVHRSAEAGRTWLGGLAGRAKGVASEVGTKAYGLPEGLLPSHQRLLLEALRGEVESDAGDSALKRNRETAERVIPWVLALSLAAAALVFILVALLAVVSNLLYEAASTPFDLRLARALVGGLGCGGGGVLLLAGAAGVLYLHRDRRRWQRTLQDAEAEAERGLLHLAQGARAQVEAGKAPAAADH